MTFWWQLIVILIAVDVWAELKFRVRSWWGAHGWAWHRTLRRETGEVYMDRWQFCRTRLLSVYINRINLPDADELPHNHPWRASWSLKLRGSYTEEIHEPIVMASNGIWLTRRMSFRTPPRLNRIPLVHRIVELRGGRPCWTLFIGWRADRPWGFLQDNGRVIPWRVRSAQRGVTADT